MLCVTFFIIIIQGCKTCPDYKPILPQEPNRKEITEEMSLEEIIIYYDFLVRSWEQWAIDVKSILNSKYEIENNLKKEAKEMKREIKDLNVYFSFRGDVGPGFYLYAIKNM